MAFGLRGVEVGDRLTITSAASSAAEYDFRKVAKVTKTSVTDNKGGRWNIRSGEQWGTSCDVYRSSYALRARPYRDGDHKAMSEAVEERRTNRIRNTLSDRQFWSKVDRPTLDKVLKLIEDAQGEDKR